MGWLDTGSYLEKLLRTHVIKYSAYFEHEDALERAKNVFIKYKTDQNIRIIETDNINDICLLFHFFLITCNLNKY